jgi:SP family arabinose:H+ symporter-like MFS transporter
MMAEAPEGTGPRSRFVNFVAFIAAVGGFLFGYDLVIISGANIFLREQFALSDAAFGFATKSANLGCITGPFLGAWLCDLLGRKKTLIFASLLLAISAIFTAIPKDITTFNIFRFVGGVGVGLCSVGSPMYLVEMSPSRLRGRLTLRYQLAIIVGAILAAFVAFFLAKYLPEDTSWRWMFGSELAAILIFVAFLFFVPESPRWLAEKGRGEEAIQVLMHIDGPEHARREMRAISESAIGQGSFSELVSRPVRRVLLIGILLGLFNNFTGWSAIQDYLPALFLKAGFATKADAILQFFVVYGFMGLMTFVAIWLVDRVGRRPLWMSNSIAMAFFLLFVGLTFHFNLRGIFVLLTIFLCVIPHALALGSLPWLMMSEIFPTRLRAKALSITTTVLWTANFSGGLLFPVLMGFTERRFGSIGPAFALFSIICLGAFVFGLKLLPETKGKLLETISHDIDNAFEKRGRSS